MKIATMALYYLLLLFVSGFASGIIAVISLQKQYNQKNMFGFRGIKFRIKQFFNKKEDVKR